MNPSSYRNLYLAGAVAAIIAALIFRRNIGAEVVLFTGQSAPNTAAGWFTMLQSNSLTGLAFLNVFDIVNYVLVGVMFVAVYVALRQTSRSYMAIATSLGIVGIAVYLVSNTAYSMLSLSSQYANASTEAQKATLLAAGQALLAMGDPGAVYEGLGGYVSLFLLAAAGVIISAVMLRSRVFGKATACVGIAACILDLVYIAGATFLPAADVYVLSASCLSIAGFLLLVWHLVIGIKLYRLSRLTTVKGGEIQ